MAATSAAPEPLQDPGRRGKRAAANRPLERLEVLRIPAPPTQERVDVGLDRRLQGGEHLLREAPFFGRVRNPFRPLTSGMVGVLRPEVLVDPRSLDTSYGETPQLSCRAPIPARSRARQRGRCRGGPLREGAAACRQRRVRRQSATGSGRAGAPRARLGARSPELVDVLAETGFDALHVLAQPFVDALDVLTIPSWAFSFAARRSVTRRRS